MAASKRVGRAPGTLASLAKHAAEPGNERGLKSGWRREKSLPAGLDAARAEIAEALAADAPVRAADGSLPGYDVAMIEVTARLLARHREADAWVAIHGVLDKKGNPRPVANFLEKSAANLFDALDRLGMSPRARMKIGLTIQRTANLDVASAFARLHEQEQDQ